MRTWFRRLRRVVQGRRPVRRPPYRPALQSLEERCLLSGGYQQTNLISDIPGLAANTDPNLLNSWGISVNPDGHLRISDNGTGLSTLYDTSGTLLPKPVTIPPPAGSTATAAPTGNVFNGTSDFVITANGKSAPSTFIFATEDGTISAWNPHVDKTHAILKVDNSGSLAVYKGLALGSNASGNFIYAADFRLGTVDVFDKNFAPTTLAGSFTDPNLPPPPLGGQGFAPFNIANIGGNLFVTYAFQKPGQHDDQAGPGNGFVDVFDTNGNFIKRFASQGTLNSPWGMALAPANFGTFSNDLLVGNFGDGRINAFDPSTGNFLGQLADANGNPISINGLWGLVFGNGKGGGATNTLFFAAGFNDEVDGLVGTLTAGTSTPGDDSPGVITALAFQAEANKLAPSVVVTGRQDSPGGRLSVVVSPTTAPQALAPRLQAPATAQLHAAHRGAVDLAFADFKIDLLA